jgi:hypothetical protein
MAKRPITALTEQLLIWVSGAPRTYGEAMEAWRTSCPRMTVWEDAVSDGLVRVERGGSMKEARVVLTPRGQAALATDSSASGPLSDDRASPFSNWHLT